MMPKPVFRAAADIAHDHGRLVSLTLSDSFCVDRHRDDFRELVQGRVDILFGNADEMLSLYEVDELDAALDLVSRECALTAVTTGADGCVIVTADERIRVPAQRSTECSTRPAWATWFAAGLPPRADLRHAARQVRRDRLDRRRGGDLPRRPATARRLCVRCCRWLRDPTEHSSPRRDAGWLDAEPDDDLRTELDGLIDAAEGGAIDDLAERFSGRLQFGTAGLRAARPPARCA